MGVKQSEIKGAARQKSVAESIVPKPGSKRPVR